MHVPAKENYISAVDICVSGLVILSASISGCQVFEGYFAACLPAVVYAGEALRFVDDPVGISVLICIIPITIIVIVVEAYIKQDIYLRDVILVRFGYQNVDITVGKSGIGVCVIVEM